MKLPSLVVTCNSLIDALPQKAIKQRIFKEFLGKTFSVDKNGAWTGRCSRILNGNFEFTENI